MNIFKKTTYSLIFSSFFFFMTSTLASIIGEQENDRTSHARTHPTPIKDAVEELVKKIDESKTVEELPSQLISSFKSSPKFIHADLEALLNLKGASILTNTLSEEMSDYTSLRALVLAHAAYDDARRDHLHQQSVTLFPKMTPDLVSGHSHAVSLFEPGQVENMRSQPLIDKIVEFFPLKDYLAVTPVGKRTFIAGCGHFNPLSEVTLTEDGSDHTHVDAYVGNITDFFWDQDIKTFFKLKTDIVINIRKQLSFFEDNLWDTIYLENITQETLQSPGIFEEIFNKLRPGGKIVFDYYWSPIIKFDENVEAPTIGNIFPFTYEVLAKNNDMLEKMPIPALEINKCLGKLNRFLRDNNFELKTGWVARTLHPYKHKNPYNNRIVPTETPLITAYKPF